MQKRPYKRCFLALGVALTSPLILLSWLEKRIMGSDCERIYGGCKEILSLWPTFIGEYLRLGFYYASCTSIAPNVCFMLGSMVAHRDTLIGSRTVIGVRSIIGRADIGDNVLVSAGVSVLSGKHMHGTPEERVENGHIETKCKTIRIGGGSFIGQGSIVMAHVGTRCTVGAGSVVMRKVPDNSTVMGNPARRVNMRPSEVRIESYASET